MWWLRWLLPRFIQIYVFSVCVYVNIYDELQSENLYSGLLMGLFVVSVDVINFAVCMWTISQICGPTCATMPFFWFMVRCWLKSLIGSIVSILAFIPAYGFLYGGISMKDTLTILWFVGMMQFFLPPCSVALLIVPLLLATLLLGEAIVDEIIGWKRSLDPIPAIDPTSACGYWKVAAVLRSSNNGYRSAQFYPVKVCNTNHLDDPFWPDYVSTVCMVEIRRRNSIWKTITLCQVSLLNGGYKKLCSFNHFGNWVDGNMFTRSVTFDFIPQTCAVRCFQSAGVVLIFLVESRNRSTLFVYDMRYGRSGSYVFKSDSRDHMFGSRAWMVSITCLDRIFNVDISVEGWRIQFIEKVMTPCSCHPLRYRSSLRMRLFELRQQARIVNCEEIVFGECYLGINHFRFNPMFVRTSNGLIGFQDVNYLTDDGPAVLYDQSRRNFTYFPNFHSLLRSDQRLTAYVNAPLPAVGVRDVSVKHCEIWPAILNQNECVEGFQNGIVYRTEFSVPKLKYHACKSLFQARSGLRNEMSAEEFRRETGVGEMDGHFDR